MATRAIMISRMIIDLIGYCNDFRVFEPTLSEKGLFVHVQVSVGDGVCFNAKDLGHPGIFGAWGKGHPAMHGIRSRRIGYIGGETDISRWGIRQSIGLPRSSHAEHHHKSEKTDFHYFSF